MFSTLLTKQNLPVLFTIGILIFTSGVLFWYGQNKIREAQDVQTTIVAWENLNNKISLSATKTNSLNLIIQNLSSQKNTYQIEFLLNSKTIDKQKIEIQAKQKITVLPNQKILADIRKSLSENKNILYQVKITWNNNKNSEILGKWLN